MKNIYINIKKKFDEKFKSRLEKISHHSKENNIYSPYHAEDDVYSHILLCEKEFFLKYNNIQLSEEQKVILYIIILCHDLGKLHTKNVDLLKKKVTFYNHDAASTQDTYEFINDIKHFDFRNIHMNIDKILRVVSNHMKYHFWNRQKCQKMFNNLIEFKMFIYLMYFDMKGNITERIIDFDDFNYFDDFEEKNYITNSPDIILVCGAPASGKDTYAKNNFPDYKIVSLDKIRIDKYLEQNDFINDPNELYQRAWVWCNKFKINLINIQNTIIKKLLNNNEKVVVCNTHINKKSRTSIVNTFKKYNINCVYLITDKSNLYKRDINRSGNDKQVGNNVINKFLYNQSIPTYLEGFNSIKIIGN
jgi:predicted kinase